MILHRTELSDVIIIDPLVHNDERGYFVETFRKDKLDDFLGFSVNFCQDNESKSDFGVFRGFHYQLPPFSQSKLVRVILGRILDVAIDVRRGSPTFGNYVTVELNGENKRQLFIPRGFAHGYVVLSDEAIFSYKVDNYYSPECERGIAYNDPLIQIDWNIEQSKIKLSQKDVCLPLLSNAEVFKYEDKLY